MPGNDQVRYVYVFYSVISEQAKRSNYRVLTPFADNAVIILFLRCSSVIVRCELKLTHASGKESCIQMRFIRPLVTKTHN